MSRNNKKRLSANAKWGIALVVEIFLVVLLVIGYVNLYVDSKLDKRKVTEIDNIHVNEGINPLVEEYTTIVLFGVDSRDGTLLEGNRTDSIMIASINNKTKEVKLVSIYRDTVLEVQDTEGNFITKVNSAYAYGGPKMAMDTLNANLDLNITAFVTVDFIGLTKAIDALGGVTVSVEADELDTLNMALAEQIAVNGIYSDGVWETGEILLNGAQATAYARIRSTDQGDITRTERQREVLGQMIAKAKKSDLSTINNIIDDVFTNIETSINNKEMKSLAKSLFSYELGDSVGFPIQLTLGEYDGMSVIISQDLSENVTALHRFLYDTENYVPSSYVRGISENISSQTGIYGNGPVMLPTEQTTEQTTEVQ